MDKTQRGVVASNIRRLRDAKGLTQEELAERADISSVKMIETGKRAGRVDTLQKVAAALGVPLAELFSSPEHSLTGALTAFLDSPLAKGVSDAEIAQLAKLSPDGLSMTPEAYHLALLMLRACDPVVT